MSVRCMACDGCGHAKAFRDFLKETKRNPDKVAEHLILSSVGRIICEWFRCDGWKEMPKEDQK